MSSSETFPKPARMGNSMKPDVIITVRFRTREEGGRQTPLIIEDIPYSCPLLIEGRAFDCRVLLSGTTLELGLMYELPIKFLSPELALPMLSPGRRVSLWEGKE